MSEGKRVHGESRKRSRSTGEAAFCSRCNSYLRDGDCPCGREIERLALEVERLQGEVVDLRRERDDEKALAEGLSKRVAMLQAEVEK